MSYFIVGFVGYFLVRYRLKIAEITRKAFMHNESRKNENRLRANVEFFELEEIWPEAEPEEKKAS